MARNCRFFLSSIPALDRGPSPRLGNPEPSHQPIPVSNTSLRNRQDRVAAKPALNLARHAALGGERRERVAEIVARQVGIRPEYVRAGVLPEGKAAVWRTSDAGESWEKLTNGLPQEEAHLGVLRGAMTFDSHDSPGLYFGTSTGQVYASTDAGESWSEIASYLPNIWSVEVAVLD